MLREIEESQLIIDLIEFEKSIDLDYPKLRDELGTDPRVYRPLAIKATAGYLMDKALFIQRLNNVDLRNKVIEQTLESLRNNPKAKDVIGPDPEAMAGVATYVGSLVVYLASYLWRPLRSFMKDSPPYEITTFPSEVMMPQGDAVCVGFKCRLLDLSYIKNPGRGADPNACPWKDENTW